MAAVQDDREAARIAEVRRLGLLDTSAQERFDRITRMARAVLGVPVAEINFIDVDRQFTFSPQNEGASLNTPREDSFCDVTIQNSGILVVPDATKDVRFSEKATVTGERHLRFYAGYPLSSAGHQVGTLCLVDTVPRDFSAEDHLVLERMGRWVEAELDNRRAIAHGQHRGADTAPSDPSRFADVVRRGLPPDGTDRGDVAVVTLPPEQSTDGERHRATPLVASRVGGVPSEILLAALAENSEGVIVTDAAQTIVFANDSAHELTGYSEDEMLGRNCRFLQGERTDPAVVADIRRTLADGATFRGFVLNYRKDGREFWNDLTVSPLRGDYDTITHFVGVQRDGSELMALREDLRVQLARAKREAETSGLLLQVARLLSSYSRASDVTDVIAEGIQVVSAADRSAVVLWDASSERLRMIAHSGWPPHLIERVSAFAVSATDVPELAALASSGRPVMMGGDASLPLQQLLDDSGVTTFAVTPMSSHGELRGILLACWVDTEPTSIETPIEDRLEGLSNLAAVALENAALMEEAVWSGTHDTLTDLPDRALFERSLDQKLDAAAAGAESVAVLYVDIDRFKLANDTLGHHAGDEVLRHVAATLLASTRGTDFVARVGGDEFVIVLSDRHAQNAAEGVASRIRTRLETPLRVNRQDVFVSVSIGIAVSDALDPTLPLPERATALTSTADAAMYRDKAARSGAPDPASPPRELAIDSALHGAVARREVTALFQPQLTPSTGTIDTVDVRVRWRHPQLGDVSPAVFLPLAERNGVIHEIGAEILRQALDLGSAALAAGTPVTVAVTVSPIQLLQDDVVDTVRAAVSRSDLSAEQVTIETTDSQSITDAHRVIKRMRELRNLGTGVSLDHFGAGTTSLLQLSELPITEVKVDQAFVKKEGPTGEALLRGIVDLAHSLGLTVVTDGVETDHHRDTASRLGSDRIQGDHIARPMSHDELLVWLGSRQT